MFNQLTSNRPLIIFGAVLIFGSLCLCALCPIVLGIPLLLGQSAAIPPVPPLPGVPPVPPSPLAMLLLVCCCPLCLIPLIGGAFLVGWLMCSRRLNLGAFSECIAALFNADKTKDQKAEQISTVSSTKDTKGSTDVQVTPKAEEPTPKPVLKAAPAPKPKSSRNRRNR